MNAERCAVCARIILEPEPEPGAVCARCAVDAFERDADAGGTFAAVADALRAVADVPAQWFHITERRNQ
jgi:hypothetical protein